MISKKKSKKINFTFYENNGTIKIKIVLNLFP